MNTLKTILIVTCLLTPPFAACSSAAQDYRSFEQMLDDPNPQLPLVQALTEGPKIHWFSYYDVLEFDPSQRYVLAMESDFDKRSLTPKDSIQIGMIDLLDNHRWIELGQSRAFGWQLGCRLQWRPGSGTEVLWNDRQEDHFLCRILDIETKKMRTLPYPIFHVSPDGLYALGLDFARLNDMDHGYGYPGTDPYAKQAAPNESGIYKINLDTGEYEFLLSLAQIAKIRFGERTIPGKMYFNHIAWSPDGSRFLFYNRGHRMNTQVYTAAADGSDIRFLGRDSSHYTWRDPKNILIWINNAYRLYSDDGSGKSNVLWEALNGHQTYLHDKNWIVTDTYPLKGSIQHLHLVHLPTKTFVPLGRFRSTSGYGGEWRCDLHPRISPDGSKVVFDSTHTSQGRQIYLIDIGKIIQSPPQLKSQPSFISACSKTQEMKGKIE